MGGVLRFGWSYKLEFPSCGHVICCANPGKSLDNMSVVFDFNKLISRRKRRLIFVGLRHVSDDKFPSRSSCARLKPLEWKKAEQQCEAN
ncbi:hypothetical protein DY000_02020756 [Brassica cretica]|uniref:Uncharacterized protein n=1 Tax=Brassica cretica TaxID=69181 RepID=A0ABQ7EJC9_BRACR|nr:hypothetical protein DY000_02020756 [Brassica cretica]